MYAGHVAAGLALKAKTIEAPTWPHTLLWSGACNDLLFGTQFVIIGLEQVSITPEMSPETSRWTTSTGSHSVAMSGVWSALFERPTHRTSGSRVAELL